jgi:predicted DNA-binding ribbon-helix-helix protein
MAPATRGQAVGKHIAEVVLHPPNAQNFSSLLRVLGAGRVHFYRVSEAAAGEPGSGVFFLSE